MNIKFAADTFIFVSYYSATLSAYLTFKDIKKYNGFDLHISTATATFGCPYYSTFIQLAIPDNF